jgi:hypothetical protein
VRAAAPPPPGVDWPAARAPKNSVVVMLAVFIGTVLSDCNSMGKQV